MSDAFGQDDTTASGGLQSDMPGIGAAPPKPSQVPNALGGLASAFKQMFGGSPAPQSPKGPTIGPQGQLQPPPPPMPGGPRQTGTTASLALPRGAQQPPAKFTPFIKSRPTRNFSDWGQPEQYPNLPQPFEVPSIYQGVGQFFQQNGSQTSIPLAFLLTGHAAEYVKGLQEGQEYKAKMALDEMKLNAAKLQIQQEDEHHAYADILSEYSVENNTLDPLKMIQPINGVSLRDAMLSQADQLGDTQIANLLHDGKPMAQIMWFQQQRDAHLQDLQKANKATEDQDNADAAKWGVPPDPAQQQPGQPGQQAPGTQQQPGATSSNAAGPQAPAAGGAAPGAAQPGAVPPGDQVASNDPASGLPQPDPNSKLLPYQQIGLDMARGQPAETTGLPKKVVSSAREYEADVNQRLDDVVAHSAGKSREQIDSELRAVSPSIAADWGKLLDGKVGLPGGMGAVGSRPYWSNLGDLALAVKPGWNAADFPRIAELNKEYDAGPTGRRMGRTESMAAAGRTLLEALQQIPEGEKPPEGALENWLNNRFTGDPRWGRVFAAYNTYVQEAQSIASQTGNFHEGDVQRVMRNTNFTAGPEFLRGSQLQVDAENAVNTMEDANADYKRYTGHDALHYNPQAMNALRTIASYDPKTNRFGQVYDPSMQGLDRSYDAQPGASAPGSAAAPSSGWGAVQ
ncbi:MAG TPA: hypothetical protein VHT52_04155 [Stellaceae bacterium]|jgi:hypothetical protein|nr:hypothetical protein [Stellaceae bacterium]